MDLAQGRVTVADLKELDIDDLLARDVIGPNQNLLLRNVAGQVVLVTGAGGSIGSELCRQILRLQPKTLVLLDHSELALYQVHEDLIKKSDALSGFSGLNISVVPVLGSVTDEEFVDDAVSEHKPHIIYHAAAYKHVPMVEANPFEGIKNNALGTATISSIAAKYIAAELDSRKYYSKERRYNERVCGWKWKCFLAVLISAILVVAGYYAYRKWWKSKK